MPDNLPDKIEKMNALASDILNLSRNTLVINLRFMDKAISMLKFKCIPEMGGMAVDGENLYYDPVFVLRSFSEERTKMTRHFLHMILHCVYHHFWVSTSVNQDFWSLACDIAVEYTINDMGIPALETSNDGKQLREINRLKSNVKYMTADMLYRYFLRTLPPDEDIAELKRLFPVDTHAAWYSNRKKEEGRRPAEGQTKILEEWEDIARQMKMDLNTFSKEKGSGRGGLWQNLMAVTREKYDYSEFLRKFAVPQERMKINDDEFDYIFYTYGFKLYEKMPLIEPLEYKDMKQIRELVIAIDTSGSTSAELVQTFVQKTYNILKEEESFSTRFNLHIIPCDADIQEDVKITNQREFDEYIANMKIHGLGGTDFRPVFSHVDELIAKREFTNLNGLIYFTDGFGTFPTKQPDYKAAFVYIEEGYENPEVPVWAIKLVLHPDDIRGI